MPLCRPYIPTLYTYIEYDPQSKVYMQKRARTMTKKIATTASIMAVIAILLPGAITPGIINDPLEQATTTTTDATAQAAYAQESIRIDGAGASFAFPLMDLWRVKYAEIYPHVALNYQSIGSGGGVKQHIEKTVSFAASDAPLKGGEYEKAPGSLTIPAMIGAISIAYNLPGVDSGLRLTSDALCGIYLGEISDWSDSRIAANNPGIDALDGPILPAARSDGSGTTFAFTSYLSKVCPKWDEEIGAGKSVPWPAGGRSAPGNEGVAGLVKSTEGAIGYITLAYAFQEDMTVAAIQNGDNTDFVMPTIESASDASSGAAPELPMADQSWTGVDLLAAPGENAYPITSFSYVIVHPDLKDVVSNANHAKEVVDLIAWTITDGQQYNAELLYVPISPAVQNIGLEGLAQITYQGEPVYTGPTSVDAMTGGEEKIPSWVKTLFTFYAEGGISDDDLINALQFLIQQGIIAVE